MNNDIDKKNVVKRKNRQSSTYELELYFKNNIKNNRNSKNNLKKYKNNKNNTTQIRKILVNDEMISETSVKKENTPLVEEVTLVKKKRMVIFKPFNKKEKNKNKSKVIDSDIYNKEVVNENVNESTIDKNDEFKVQDVNLVKKKKFFIFKPLNKKKNIKDKKDENKTDKVKKKITFNNLNQAKISNNEKTFEKDESKEKIEACETLKEINKNNKKKRKRKYLKEALLFTIIILLFDIVLYFITDYISMLRLFDIQYLNVILTIIITFISLFIGSFLINYLISELLIEFKNKWKRMKEEKKEKSKQNVFKHGGDSYPNQRVKQEKHRENRKVKK